jgi:hypothetical protein
VQLEDEVETIVRHAAGRAEDRIAENTELVDQLAGAINAIEAGLIEGMRFLARRVEALESQS